ncbi:hypothetical protein [Antrihabitans sp. YC2-6]|uniref:hypothetical protein n=1 Tax=Antrihabitans sp. YC2-6 TaxID=2799498 RepID=UPI0018F4A1AE|nr:hypothetical protein [Antrihabitans sp. YC2-6]MBJ8348557.1 hypothetical protein [Antrihabitans sp. YC2-6]
MVGAPSANPSLRSLQGNLTPKAAAAIVREHLDPNDIRVFVRSSPARLLALGVVIVTLCLVAGIVAANTTSNRQQTLNELLAESEPFAASAQQLYSSLSVADAAAATAFIAGGLEPQDVRDRYTQAIGEAATELTSASGSPDPEAPARKLLSSVASFLPVYTGLVETARTNNRSGYPVGAAYLAEASTLMQSKMLPAAEELHARQASAVADTQRRFVQPPWLAFGLLVLALAALVVAQLILLRHWHRIFNPGMILASLTMAALLVWMIVAGWLSASATNRALHHGSVPLGLLTESRILAQQARSDETLKLVRRDTTGQFDSFYDDDMARLAQRLGEYGTDTEGAHLVADALAAQERWLVAHKRMNDTLDAGDFAGAAVVAIGPGDADSAAQFEAVDSAIAQAILDTRATLRANISRAARSLEALGAGAMVLAILSTLWIALGLWPRLREYR